MIFHRYLALSTLLLIVGCDMSQLNNRSAGQVAATDNSSATGEDEVIVLANANESGTARLGNSEVAVPARAVNVNYAVRMKKYRASDLDASDELVLGAAGEVISVSVYSQADGELIPLDQLQEALLVGQSVPSPSSESDLRLVFIDQSPTTLLLRRGFFKDKNLIIQAATKAGYTSVQANLSLTGFIFGVTNTGSDPAGYSEYPPQDALSPTPTPASTNEPTMPATVVNLTSSNPNGSYRAAQGVTIEVEFSEAVTVTGTPRIEMAVGTAGRYATYLSGSTTNKLNFYYTVQSGDTSADLDYSAATSLELNGGTIKNNSAVAATLTLPTPGQTHSLASNRSIILDTAAPPTILNAQGLPSGSLVNFTWIYPSSVVDYHQVVIRRTNGGTAPSCTTGSAAVTLSSGFSNNGSGNVDDTGLGDGVYSYRFCIYDGAGNIESSQTVTGVTIGIPNSWLPEDAWALTYCATEESHRTAVGIVVTSPPSAISTAILYSTCAKLWGRTGTMNSWGSQSQVNDSRTPTTHSVATSHNKLLMSWGHASPPGCEVGYIGESWNTMSIVPTDCKLHSSKIGDFFYVQGGNPITSLMSGTRADMISGSQLENLDGNISSAVLAGYNSASKPMVIDVNSGEFYAKTYSGGMWGSGSGALDVAKILVASKLVTSSNGDQVFFWMYLDGTNYVLRATRKVSGIWQATEALDYTSSQPPTLFDAGMDSAGRSVVVIASAMDSKLHYATCNSTLCTTPTPNDYLDDQPSINELKVCSHPSSNAMFIAYTYTRNLNVFKIQSGTIDTTPTSLAITSGNVNLMGISMDCSAEGYAIVGYYKYSQTDSTESAAVRVYGP